MTKAPIGLKEQQVIALRLARAAEAEAAAKETGRSNRIPSAARASVDQRPPTATGRRSPVKKMAADTPVTKISVVQKVNTKKAMTVAERVRKYREERGLAGGPVGRPIGWRKKDQRPSA